MAEGPHILVPLGKGNEKLKQDFKEYCEYYGVSMSSVLNEDISRRVKKHKERLKSKRRKR